MGGRLFAPPRYYDKWMDQIHEKDEHCGFGKACEEHRRVLADVRDARGMAPMDERTDYTVQAWEKHHESRVNLYQQRGKV